ncbi:hypothetical protein DLM75_00085 [Leptospira stimsonii]|uniref:Uncharacterized protein n=1 Tax=Leptospira stimsonii TaxID=2202203 RepID=A0A396ZD82_9LEPT|nr:hypothetical protein DLM75_00085 [Leptospira stimsonii]
MSKVNLKVVCEKTETKIIEKIFLGTYSEVECLQKTILSIPIEEAVESNKPRSVFDEEYSASIDP